MYAVRTPIPIPPSPSQPEHENPQIRRWEDGTPQIARWYDEKGQPHREDGPAHQEFYESGAPEAEIYFDHGKYHRRGGPATLLYAEDGTPTMQRWAVHGLTHRLDGPAEVQSSDAGEPWNTSFYFRGRRCMDLDEVHRFAAEEPDEWLADEFAHTSYAPLLEDGGSPRALITALTAGVRTPEGLREIINGAPVEWVRSFEEGRS